MSVNTWSSHTAVIVHHHRGRLLARVLGAGEGGPYLCNSISRISTASTTKPSVSQLLATIPPRMQE